MISLTGSDWEETASGLLVPPRPKRPTAVDLFAGCGGFSIGIIAAGFDVLAAVEWDEVAAFSYMLNLGAYPIDLRCVDDFDRMRLDTFLRRHGGSSRSGQNRTDGGGVPVFWFGDIHKISGEQILKSIGLGVGDLDLLVGGPPCQGFSMAGKRSVMDPRNSLVFEFARLVCEMKPKTICMENVPGIRSMVTEQGIPVLDEFCAILERGEYGEHEALLRMLAGDPKARVARRRPASALKRKREECGRAQDIERSADHCEALR